MVKPTLKHTSNGLSAFSYEFHIFMDKSCGNKLLWLQLTQYRSLKAAQQYTYFLTRLLVEKPTTQNTTNCCKKGLSHHSCPKKIAIVKGQRQKRIPESQDETLFRGWLNKTITNESVLIHKDQVEFQNHQNIFRSSIISLKNCIFYSCFWSIVARFQNWFKLGKEQHFNCFDGNTITTGFFFMLFRSILREDI